ncbi:MAG: acyl-CoA dehydrogenase [Pseudomonadota bacterium]
MDFELNQDQHAIVEAVDRLLDQRAGAARAIELARDNDYDAVLHKELDEAGFCQIARDLASGGKLAGLEAALIVEAVARSAGIVAAGAQLLVAPAVSEVPVAGPIALCTDRELAAGTPIRYAAHARHLLVLTDEEAVLVALQDQDMMPVQTSFGYPMGRLHNTQRTAELCDVGESLGRVSHTLQNWWRLSLAVEAVGTMEAALNHTVSYLKQRRQFGRTIGSFQAVQHRLAQCAIQLEASRWLAREAAYHNAGAEATATAAAFALHAADQLFTETHQLSGAIGFTREFDLHVWSMRLLGLRQELNGVGGARRALVEARWST